MNVAAIFEKYNLHRDSYFPQDYDPYKAAKEYFDAVMSSYQGRGWPTWELDKPNVRWIKNKWKDRIRENSIGFSLYAIPEIWVNIIDEILIQIMQECPGFTIDFIGVKNAGIKFSLNNVNEGVLDALDIAEYELFDYRLIK